MVKRRGRGKVKEITCNRHGIKMGEKGQKEGMGQGMAEEVEGAEKEEQGAKQEENREKKMKRE